DPDCLQACTHSLRVFVRLRLKGRQQVQSAGLERKILLPLTGRKQRIQNLSTLFQRSLKTLLVKRETDPIIGNSSFGIISGLFEQLSCVFKKNLSVFEPELSPTAIALFHQYTSLKN